jgi:hypothetical protein
MGKYFVLFNTVEALSGDDGTEADACFHHMLFSISKEEFAGFSQRFWFIFS